jgi:hypothetical protein
MAVLNLDTKNINIYTVKIRLLKLGIKKIHELSDPTFSQTTQLVYFDKILLLKVSANTLPQKQNGGFVFAFYKSLKSLLETSKEAIKYHQALK